MQWMLPGRTYKHVDRLTWKFVTRNEWELYTRGRGSEDVRRTARRARGEKFERERKQKMVDEEFDAFWNSERN